ncbi:MAG: hypothetical protein K2J79_09800, partial [Ruminiclostridium sp.]|nr:hypothetical protein [Ruminiclostridium sp.]
MGRLLTNELIKVFHRRSCRVMALIMLIVAIGTPLLSKLTYVMNDKPRDTTEEYYQIMYEQEKGARKEMYKAVLEDIAELKKNGIGIDGWRKDYFNYYLRYANTITALDLIQQGSNIEEVSSGMAYSPLIQRGLDGEYKFLHITEEYGLSGASLEEVSFKKEVIPKYKEEVQV